MGLEGLDLGQIQGASLCCQRHHLDLVVRMHQDGENLHGIVLLLSPMDLVHRSPSLDLYFGHEGLFLLCLRIPNPRK